MPKKTYMWGVLVKRKDVKNPFWSLCFPWDEELDKPHMTYWFGKKEEDAKEVAKSWESWIEMVEWAVPIKLEVPVPKFSLKVRGQNDKRKR